MPFKITRRKTDETPAEKPRLQFKIRPNKAPTVPAPTPTPPTPEGSTKGPPYPAPEGKRWVYDGLQVDRDLKGVVIRKKWLYSLVEH